MLVFFCVKMLAITAFFTHYIIKLELQVIEEMRGFESAYKEVFQTMYDVLDKILKANEKVSIN